MDTRVTGSLIGSVRSAKESRTLTVYTKDFPNFLTSFLAKNSITNVGDLTLICESIVEQARKIDEYLDILYKLDISSVILETEEHLHAAKDIISRTYGYSFGKQDNFFYPVNYEEITKMVRNYYPKYETLAKLEKISNADHTISNLLTENKLSVQVLETLLEEQSNKKGIPILSLARNLYLGTDRLLNSVYGIRTRLENVAKMRLLYEHHRKAIDDTI